MLKGAARAQANIDYGGRIEKTETKDSNNLSGAMRKINHFFDSN